MLIDTYKTIEDTSEGFYSDKGSKFFAFAYPVRTEDEIKALLNDLKKRYYDARHHCYAYRLGVEGELWRAVDDGEPSSSAGKPILGQLLSNNLTFLVVFVVRYFGGIKLGVPGLIHAYKTATIDAINNSIVVEKQDCELFKLNFDYSAMNEVMKIIKEDEPEVFDRQFDLNCSLKIAIRRKEADNLKGKFLKINTVKITEI